MDEAFGLADQTRDVQVPVLPYPPTASLVACERQGRCKMIVKMVCHGLGGKHSAGTSRLGYRHATMQEETTQGACASVLVSRPRTRIADRP